MSARERNAARYRLEDGLEFWHERWVMAGAEVLCSTCQARQFAHEAGDPFRHVEGCAMTSDFAKYPWRELAELLRELPAVPVRSRREKVRTWASLTAVGRFADGIGLRGFSVEL